MRIPNCWCSKVGKLGHYIIDGNFIETYTKYGKR
jgi:hypothetical protein